MTGSALRPDVLLVSDNPELVAAFREACQQAGRSVRLHHYPTLDSPSALDLHEPWRLICLDLEALRQGVGDAWPMLMRRWMRQAPHVKWLLCALQPEPPLQPLRGYLHALLLSPWTVEALRASLKRWLFPDPAFQALFHQEEALPPRPAWLLQADEIPQRLEEGIQRLGLLGIGLVEPGKGPLLWVGQPWPRPLRDLEFPQASGTLQHLALWSQDGVDFWLYALPVFQKTWLAAWGNTPLAYATLAEHLAALRDALQHMEPPTAPEGPEDEDLPPEAAQPLFDDVPPPFPDFPFPS